MQIKFGESQTCFFLFSELKGRLKWPDRFVERWLSIYKSKPKRLIIYSLGLLFMNNSQKM